MTRDACQVICQDVMREDEVRLDLEGSFLKREMEREERKRREMIEGRNLRDRKKDEKDERRCLQTEYFVIYCSSQ